MIVLGQHMQAGATQGKWGHTVILLMKEVKKNKTHKAESQLT